VAKPEAMKSATGDRDEITPIIKHPAFATATQLLQTLSTEKAALHKTVVALQAAAYLRDQADAGLSDSAALDQAQKLLAGEPLDVRDGPALIREAQLRIGVIEPAVREQVRRIAKLRGELSVDAGRRVQARHRKTLLDLYGAARALAAAGQAELTIRAELLDAGYELNEVATACPRFAVHLQLADESWYDGPLAIFRRQLEELGILP
jgi:hypothetical protein